MTKAVFYLCNGAVTGFCVTGHSSKDCDDELGKTVCAAVSSAVYMAANTVLEVLGQPADTAVNDADFRFRVKTGSKQSDIVLRGLKLHLESLAEQYPDRIEVLTEV